MIIIDALRNGKKIMLVLLIELLLQNLIISIENLILTCYAGVE